MEAGFGIIFIILIGGIALLGLASCVFWIWMLIDCISNESSSGNDKIVWLLVIVFTHFIGALLYFVLRRPQRMKELGR